MIRIPCPKCRSENLPYEEKTYELRFKNDCLYDFECPHGHRFQANVLYHEFQKLFELGITFHATSYYREALVSYASAYERFVELFIRVSARARGMREADFEESWKHVSRQSERQLGAYVFLYAMELNEPPKMLSGKLVNLRNKTIHQGYFPDEKVCADYGEAVLGLMREAISAAYRSTTLKDELIRAINDQADFEDANVKLHYFAYPLIGTNRPPEREKNLFSPWSMTQRSSRMIESGISQPRAGSSKTPLHTGHSRP